MKPIIGERSNNILKILPFYLLNGQCRQVPPATTLKRRTHGALLKGSETATEAATPCQTASSIKLPLSLPADAGDYVANTLIGGSGDIIRLMENQKYSQVEGKLQQLAQIKLSSLSQQTLLNLEHRLAAADSSLAQLAAAADTTNRHLRHLLRTSLEKAAEVEAKSAAALQQRQREMEELRRSVAVFEQREAEERQAREEKTAVRAEEEAGRLQVEVGELREGRKRSTASLNHKLLLQLPAAKQQIDASTLRSNQHSELRMGELEQTAEQLRAEMGAAREERVLGEVEVEKSLRATVGEVKALIREEKACRESTRDKLMGLAEEAAKNLLCK